MSEKKKLPGRIRIVRDPDPLNPRTEHDNITVMICRHERYILGDSKESKAFDFAECCNWSEVSATLYKKYKPLAIKPLYMYDHSGITISTSPFSCPWDSGQVGFVLVPGAKRGEYWNNDSKEPPTEADLKAWAERIIDGDVKVYDQYLTGDVCGFIIDEAVRNPLFPDEQMLDCDDQPVFDENEDSCWGFYGSDWKTNGMADHFQHKIDAGYTMVMD